MHKTNRSPPYPYCREHSEALPALGSERRVHGVLVKRRQVRLLRTTRAVARKPLCQGKKSSAKARGHSECPWLGREAGMIGGKCSVSNYVASPVCLRTVV